MSPPDRKVVNESVVAWRIVAAEQPANPQAKDMLEGLLHDLRMQYVALINAPQKARTFTGSDITGGR